MTEAIADVLRDLGGGTQGTVLRGFLMTAQMQSGLGELLERIVGPTRITGRAASTWIGLAANDDADPDQLEDALGSDTVAQVAIMSTMSHDQAKEALALLLPRLIDRLSPDGRLPERTVLSETASDLVNGITPDRPGDPATPPAPLGTTNLAHLLRERRRKD